MLFFIVNKVEKATPETAIKSKPDGPEVIQGESKKAGVLIEPPPIGAPRQKLSEPSNFLDFGPLPQDVHIYDFRTSLTILRV